MAQKVFIVVNEHPLEAASLAMGLRAHRKLKEMGVDVGAKPAMIRVKVVRGKGWREGLGKGFRGESRSLKVIRLAEAHPNSIVVSFHNTPIDKHLTSPEMHLYNFFRSKSILECTFHNIGNIQIRANLFELVKDVPGFPGNVFFLEMSSMPRDWYDGLAKHLDKRIHAQCTVTRARQNGFLDQKVVDLLAQKMCRFFRKKLGSIPRRPGTMPIRPLNKKSKRKARRRRI